MFNITYRPLAGSLACRVISYFKAGNQEESLSTKDIATKFGVPEGNVHPCLNKALKCGVLRQTFDSVCCENVWMLDDVSKCQLPSEISSTAQGSTNSGQNFTPTPTPIPEPEFVNVEAKAAEADAGMPFTAPIMAGSPDEALPPAKRERKRHLALYQKWFASFKQVGDHALFGLQHMRDVSQIATKFSKANGVLLRCKAVSETQAKIVRVK